MLNKAIFILVIVLMSTIQCEEGEEYWSGLTKNGIFYRILHDHYYNIDDHLSILHKGDVAGIDQMQSLLLYNTGIEEIEPGAFTNLTNLRTLRIAGGNLKGKIGPGIFNSLNLDTLEIDSCKLTTIPSNTFDGMTSLRKIRLDGNGLRRWDPEWFAKTPSLRQIYMNSNQLEEIPADAVKNLNEIEDLFLYDNKIKNLDRNAFRGVRKISTLQLTKNHLANFNANLEGIKIYELRLTDNKIQCLPEEQLDNIFVATTTLVDENPWDPDCLKKVKEWTRSHQRNYVKF